MFGFGKKTVDYQKIKDFSDAINAVKILLGSNEFEKAGIALKEVREKEKESFGKLETQITTEEEKERLKKEFAKNNLLIDSLEQKLRVKQEAYTQQRTKEIFVLKFKKIKEDLTILNKTNRHQEALLLLGSFFEENKNNIYVVKFYDEEKRKIVKSIEIQRRKEETQLHRNAQEEAMKLIGETIKIGPKVQVDENGKEIIPEKTHFDLFSPVKAWFRFYTAIKEGREKRRLLDDVTKLMEVEDQASLEAAKSKLEKVHQGLIKELSVSNIVGYDFFGKILGADRITGDAFGFHEEKDKYDFFLGDATGHGVRAGLIVSLLSRLFTKFVVGNYLTKMVFEINNGLKQDLQSRNFITGIFFEISKDEINRIRFVGMGHEPMFIYRSATKTVEKVIPGGLAAGIRMMKEEVSVKEKDILMNSDDILLCYSDGIPEARSAEGTLLGVDKVGVSLQKIATMEKNLSKIYTFLMDEVKIWRGGAKFDDDVTIILLRRDEVKDIVTKQDGYLEEIGQKEGLGAFQMRKFVGKTKEEIEKELEKIRKEKELESIVKVLESLYYTGEVLKLKQEAIRFIKAGFIHKKINFYLKKAIANENSYKVEQKNKKIASKYTLLEELFKKGDFTTVMKECNEIISKDGNI